MDTTHPPAHPHEIPTNMTPPQKKTLWARFTYCGRETRAITKVFKKSKISFYTNVVFDGTSPTFTLLVCLFSVYFTMMSVPQNYNFDTRIIDVMINSKRRGPGLYEIPFCLETFCGSAAQTMKNLSG